jgi:hypothetical protein
MNRDFLKEAIADAKAVKESAIANAKAALEEAFTPKLQAMFASKLEEMENDEDLEEEYDGVDEAEEMELSIDEVETEEMDLDELLAELEGDLEEETINEEESEEEESEEESEEEESEEEFNIEDMSEAELKKFIEDVISDMVEAGELEDMPEEDEEIDLGMEDGDEEIDLEIEDDEIEENIDEEVNDLLEKEELMEIKTELKEAYKVIKTLRSELNEINLLNAKLLYTNKIFKNKNLTESQKTKVLGAFDKATTVKETKLVFESIQTSLNPKPSTKRNISENIVGLASKTVVSNNTPKQPIVESNEMVKRFQKLAGII